jgi:hypothetical protein
VEGGKGRAARKADLTATVADCLDKMWEPQRLTTLWVSMACYWDTFYRDYIPSGGKMVDE